MNFIKYFFIALIMPFYSNSYSTTLSTITQTNIPIVVLHGILSNAENMETFSNWLEDTFNRKVFNIEIGNGKKTSIFTPLDDQLAMLCETIYSEDELQKGFDFIGMSQGGILARGYVERCNSYPVRNLINLVSPNGGVFIKNINIDMYSQFNQNHLSVSGYWRDPNKLDEYLNICSYLPIINNERWTCLSEQYKENILNLQNYVVVWSPNDEVLHPPESAKFSVFDSDYNIIPLEDTDLYIDDLIGLRRLDELNKFGVYETNCSHVDHNDPICFNQLYKILSIYL